MDIKIPEVKDDEILDISLVRQTLSGTRNRNVKIKAINSL